MLYHISHMLSRARMRGFSGGRPGIRTLLALVAAFSLQTVLLTAQEHGHLDGVVLHEDGDSLRPLPGAGVFWIGSGIGVMTGADGSFSIRRPATEARLAVTHAGYVGDTLEAVPSKGPLRIVLRNIKTLDSYTVEGERKGVSLAPIEFRTEAISQAELEKAPCCELSGCFSTTLSVEPGVTDIITDLRELRMLGLSGAYTYILLDNTPTLFTGINSQYGLSFIPGPLIRQMYVVKGANSVLQGYESVSGMVNVLLKERESADALFLNLFANSSMEKQVNASASGSFGGWNTTLSGHLVLPALRVDHDGAGFLDMPRIDRQFLLNTWSYQSEDVTARINGKYTYEQRIGGQYGFDPVLHAGGTGRFGQVVDNRRSETAASVEAPAGGWGRVRGHIAASAHDQNAWYGATRYEAAQRHAYADASVILPFGGGHSLTAGASYKFLSLDENLRFAANPLNKTYDGRSSTVESVPGLFAESKLEFFDDKLVVIAGFRADAHNEHGFLATPRIFAKWSPAFDLTLRGVAGLGYRRPFPRVENAALFASGRDLAFPEQESMEHALNYGFSATKLAEFAGMGVTLTLDAFRTEFRRQLIVDYDADPDRFLLVQPDEPSASTNVVAEILLDPAKGLETKVAYAFTDAWWRKGDRRLDIPFISRHKLLAMASYEHAPTGLSGAATLEWHGPQGLPDRSAYPDAAATSDESPSYSLLNFQITKRWSTLEVYAGIENLFDFRQKSPILGASDPFGRRFETTFAWGPVKGREVFAGIRFRLAPLESEGEHDH